MPRWNWSRLWKLPHTRGLQNELLDIWEAFLNKKKLYFQKGIIFASMLYDHKTIIVNTQIAEVSQKKILESIFLSAGYMRKLMEQIIR